MMKRRRGAATQQRWCGVGEETASQFQRAIQLLNTDHFARAHRRRLNRCGRSPSDQAICGWSPASLVTPWNALLPAPDAMHVGRPTLTTEHGVHEHMDVHFGPRRWGHLDLIDRDEVAVLVDSTLLIDQQTVGNGVGLTLIVPSSPDHATLTESMHQFQPNWLAPLDRGQSASFLDGGYVVSQVRSRRPPPYRQCPAGTHTGP